MTLKDIAKEAGVSKMTVSNVINGNSQIIFLIIPLSDDTTNIFYSPYISSLVGIMEHQLRTFGYYALIRSVYSLDELDSLFKNWPAEGAIILLPDFDNIVDQILDRIHIPLVFLDSYHTRQDLINVSCADEKGTYLATKYLINLDHRNIAFMADYKNNLLLTSRFNGYCRALSESGIPLKEELVFEEPPDYDHGIQVGQAIASGTTPISAIVTTSDYGAIGIMEGARLGGLKLPTQLSVIGFDNLPFCNYCSPKLTTVSQDIDAKAHTAVELLMEKITTGALKKNKITIDVSIIERQSVTHYV